MTYGGTDRPISNGSVRDDARERAKELRELHRKKDRRRTWIVWSSVVGGVLLSAAAVTWALVALNDTDGRTPVHAQQDGISIGEGFTIVGTAPATTSDELPAPATPGPTTEPTPSPTPTPTATAASSPIEIRIYVDYLCANCGAFQESNGATVRALIESGGATLDVHPIAVLTTKSAGTQYSLRAANAAACVAEYSPEAFYDFHVALLTDQPAEGSVGLSDEELVERAEAAGVSSLARVEDCVRERTFRAWVRAATERAISGPIPGSDIESVVSTPTILVNGEQFVYSAGFDPNEFRQFVLRSAGESFAETSTPTPTPEITPAP